MRELVNLVCLSALDEANREVENAQCRCGEAAAALMRCRSELDRAVERASKPSCHVFGTQNWPIVSLQSPDAGLEVLRLFVVVERDHV